MLATPAQADGKKHHRHHYWEDEGRYRYYDRAWDNRGYRYYRPYYRKTTATTIESLITTDRTIIAVQYSSFGSDRTKSASAERLRTRKCAV